MSVTATISARQSRKRYRQVMSLLAIGCVGLFVWLLFCGTVQLPAEDVWRVITGSAGDDSGPAQLIVMQLRLPMACCALLAGMGLAVAGLLLQTTFNNPLAGPSILGVSTGASLGVAVMMLALGGGASLGVSHYAGAMGGAIAGAAVMLALLLLFSRIVRGTAMLLIVGILMGYLASSAISILNFYATEEGVHSFMLWGLGSFAGVNPTDLAVFGPLILLLSAASLLLVKPLDAMLLGDDYARSMGVNIRSTRGWLLLLSGLLTAAVTAFCGPIGFLGLAMPHVARLSLATTGHHRLLPATILWGAFSGLLCACLSILCGAGSMLPVNAITPLLAVPVIIYIIVRHDHIPYFQ